MTGEAHSSNHPPLPPTTEDQRYSWLRLLRSRRIGIATFYRLLAEFGSAQNVLSALPECAAAAGVKGYKIYPTHLLDAEINVAKAAGARLLCFGDTNYPTQLMQLKTAPPVLWALGDISLLSRPIIALVGARNASSLGMRMAATLAHDLGRKNQVIVSGLARGIDTAAHQAALDSGTIAVVAGGVDTIYPAENKALTQSIAQTGLILSEHPMGMTPQARHFPARNRIIAGLGSATIVVEAAAKSGSLITARDALDLGREVFAVPGHPLDARASGCNILIRDGALLVRHADDVLAALPPTAGQAKPLVRPALRDLPQSPEQRNLRETAALHQEVLTRLSPSPTDESDLIEKTTNETRSVIRSLTDLELDDEVIRQPGGGISRNS